MLAQTTDKDMALEVAQRTAGVEAPPQVSLDDYLNSVFSHGILAAVHIGRMNWLQRLEAKDYGLEELPKNHKAGHRVLLEGPIVDEIAQFEGATRYWLQKASLKFPVELIRFVPKTRLGDVLADFDARRNHYRSLVEQLIEQYPQLQENARAKYPDQWQRMVAAYPSVEKIRAAHHMKLETFEYAFPRAFASSGETLDRLVVDREYRARQEQMIQQQQEQARATMVGFIDQTVRDLRGRVVERFQEVITNARNGQPVTLRTVNSLRAMMEEVRQMDFVGDRAFQEQMETVSRELEGADGRTFRDSQAALQALDDAMNGVIQYARETTGGAVQSLTAGFLTGKRKLSL